MAIFLKLNYYLLDLTLGFLLKIHPNSQLWGLILDLSRSLCPVLFLESIYVLFRKGPPRRAPLATLGLGLVESSHLKPSVQPVVALAGIEALL